MGTHEQVVPTKTRISRSSIAHRFVTLALIVGLLLSGVPVASATEERNPDTPEGAYNPDLVDGFGIASNAFADALDLNPAVVNSVSFGSSDPNGYTVFTTPASGFPRGDGGGNSYLMMSSGCTSLALRANTSSNTSCELGGLNNSQGNDMVQMRLTLNVPPAAVSWFIDWKFFSEEFPEWVGSQYNDTLLIEQGSSNFTLSPFGGITAPNNKAIHSGNRLITVNDLGNITANPEKAFGTTYDAATSTLQTCAGVPEPGTPLTLIFTIMDLGDSIYDSTAFIDKFRFSANPPCTPPTDLVEECGNNIDDNGNGQIDEGCNTAPTVNPGGPYAGSEGSPVTLNGSVIDPNAGDTITAGWSYTPGSGVDSGATCSFANPSALNTTLTCTDDGIYHTTLTVSDGVHTVSAATTVTVGNVAPTAGFTTPSQVSEGSPIVIQLSKPADPSSVDRAAGFSYAFDCGSGYSSASSSASISCPTTDNGLRTVRARVSDKDGGTTEYVAQVIINNVAPTASFTASTPVNEGSPIVLALSNPSDPSSADTAAGFSYAFDCGSGYSSTSSAASFSCPTTDNGVRTVKAKISDKNGGTTEYTATSNILNVAPTATFTASSQVNEGQSISLALTNPKDPSSSDTTAGFSYTFDCGSGYSTASSAASASCTTNDNEVRTVRAKISDKDGGFTEYTATSTVRNIPPAATFSAPSLVDEGDGFTLTLSNPGDPSSVDTVGGFSYAFDCGSGYGTASSSPTANCTTNDNGLRTVKAKISDKDGGTTEYHVQVTINNIAPIASFITPSFVDEGDGFTLRLSNPSDPSSVDTAAGFSYAFDCGSGYGTASSTATANCTTNDNSVRTVKAKISDKNGGTTEYVAEVTINNVAPIATFTSPSQVDEGSPIVLTLSNPSDPSSVDTANGFSYAFDCGSGYGTASSTRTASCPTNDNGVRTVKARIGDKDGDTTEYSAQVTINNVAPIATFTTTAPVNEGDPFVLALSAPSDPSSVDTIAGFSYAFDCGSGYGSASSTPTANCATDDNEVRTVKAKISDKDGGFTEYTATSTIDNVAPTASFTASSQVNEGSPIVLALTNPKDPSSSDTTAGFSYAFDCGNGYGTASSTPTASCDTNDNGVRTVKAKISDKDGDFTEYTATSTIDNVAPIASFTAPSSLDEGDGFTLRLSAPSDPSSVDTAAGFSYAFDCGNGYGSASSTPTANCTTNDNQVRTVKAKISDKDGGTTEYVAEVTINNVAPVATFTASSPVNEGSPIVLTLSNPSDPSSVDTAGGFSYAFDCGSGYGTASSTATANCTTNDNGLRTVRAKISDKDGGTTEYSAQVTINNVAPVVGPITAPTTAVATNTTINVSAPFSDPGTADTHTAVIDWGNNTTSAGTVTYNPTTGTGTVQASYAYPTPGIYTVKITVTDDDGDSGSALFRYVVVYDPDPQGAAVRGRAKFTSPAGAYVANPTLTGDATAGLNAGYKNPSPPSLKGTSTFQFSLGNLNFSSTTYDWLVVVGAKAQYQGSGTINNQGNYGFMVAVIDGSTQGGGNAPDKIRIMIWDKNNSDAIVYDTQRGAPFDADPTLVTDNAGNIEIIKQ